MDSQNPECNLHVESQRNASLENELEGKYTEWPNPQRAENHACDRQSGLSDSAP